MIRECWQFNYLFDVDFLMRQFDADVKELVTVKVVHGSWKRESENRIRVDVGLPIPCSGRRLLLCLVGLFQGRCGERERERIGMN
jgi:hypothetical protein